MSTSAEIYIYLRTCLNCWTLVIRMGEMKVVVAFSVMFLLKSLVNRVKVQVMCYFQLGDSYWTAGNYSKRISLFESVLEWVWQIRCSNSGRCGGQIASQCFQDHYQNKQVIIKKSLLKQYRCVINTCAYLTIYIQNNSILQGAPSRTVHSQMSEQENLEQFKSHLSLIKAMTGDKAEQEFYELMEKAKAVFGDLNLHMGEFYFEYAKFLLEKMEKNIDIFNAGSLPVGEQAQENPIPEDMYEDDSSEQDNSERPKSENNETHKNGAEKENGKDKINNDPVITEDKAQNENSTQLKGKSGQKVASEEQQQEAEGGIQGQDDDFQICSSNLQCAIKIFETERDRIKAGGQQGKYSLCEVQKWISRCKSRLGDMYQLSENYSQAVNTYREVVHDEQQKAGHESNRGLAEIHYMIANSFLYENKEGCEKIAIQQFIKSVQILVNNLNLLSTDGCTVYEVPTEEKVKVDRFAYLPKSSDSAEQKEIKQVVSCLLDKIEDTYQQISIRKQYQEQKRKTKQLEGEQNKFKEVTADVPVVKLGTFGNRKKKPQQIPDEGFKPRDK